MHGSEGDAFRPADFGIGRLFEHIRDAVIVADAASERIVLWNDCATELFGYSREEALELPLHALVPERLRAAHRAGLARYQETGTGELVAGSARVVELSALCKDGTELPIELSLTAIPERTPDGNRFAMAIIRDATDRKLAEEARLVLHDAEISRRQALQLNDDIVQGLAIAKMAFEMGHTDRMAEALRLTLDRAQAIVSDLIQNLAKDGGLQPGDLLREEFGETTPDPT
jgi:PAS domain S-box-containing protein